MPYETVGDQNQRKILTPDTMAADKVAAQTQAQEEEKEKTEDAKKVPLDQRRSS